MPQLEAGAKAPEFTLPNQDGTPVSLEAFKGQRVILYFYPADDTPGCTREACQFNDNLAAFQAAGVPVIGISGDDAQSHQRFRNKYGLQFPLLTDADHQVMDAYGAWGEKTRFGQTSIGVLRSTFLVDEQGPDRAGLAQRQGRRPRHPGPRGTRPQGLTAASRGAHRFGACRDSPATLDLPLKRS